MKFFAGVFMLCLVAIGSVVQPVLAADDHVQARAFIEQVQQLLRSQTSMARYNMEIHTADWQRKVRMDAWDDRSQRRFFIRILEPIKDKNTTWLKDGGNLWMYLPKLERDIRIPPSMMLSKWMGSDFTNDDLVKMESVVNDYDHRIVGIQQDVYTIESIPHPDAPVVWGKLIHRLTADGMPLSVDYFDEHGKHIRQLTYSDIREMGGRRLPVRWQVQVDETPDRHTTMLLEDIKFDVPIEDDVFTRSNLRRKAR